MDENILDGIRRNTRTSGLAIYRENWPVSKFCRHGKRRGFVDRFGRGVEIEIDR